MPTQKDQQSVVPNPRPQKAVYVPQQTLQYKTFLKRTMTEALQNAFALYGLKEPESPHQYDATLGKTKIGPDYQTTRVNFPSVVVKFYEQQIMNAGVGHMEWGPETTEINLTGTGRITKGSGELTELDTVQFLLPGVTEVKGDGIPKGAIVIRIVDETSVLLDREAYETRKTNLTIRGELDINENFIEYHHSIYHGDIALEVYGLSSVDRDKVADALVEVVQMGIVGAEGKSFQERIYDTIGLSPYSQWHFIAINTDLFKGFGEREELAPWMPEDTWVYRTEYRVPIIGEFYSITPKGGEGTLNLVKRVKLYPWLEANAGISDEPEGHFGEVAPEEFPEGKVPEEDYYNVPPIPGNHERGFSGQMRLHGSLKPKLITGNLFPEDDLFPEEDLFPG